MYKASLGVLGLSAAVFALTMFTASVSNVSAESAPPPPACNTLKEEAACTGRDDCSWVHAVMDKKTGKEKRKAYCRKKPMPKKKK